MSEYATLPIYANLHRVRLEIIASLDDPYTLDQLRAPRINLSVVKPLVNRLWDLRDTSLVFCLLVNKLQFLREQAFPAHQSINLSRAQLCELAAVKILRRYDEENTGQSGLLYLSHVFCASFSAFQGAPEAVCEEAGVEFRTDQTSDQNPSERRSTALEVAIISGSKMLISCQASQKVMDAIYIGRIVYTPSSFIDILPDHYKHKPIELYRPQDAPFLNQYRLMVPRTRNALDIIQFCVLLVLYVLVMINRDYDTFTGYELIFCIYTTGWVLDELASILEHGWHCYTQNLWSFLDLMFSLIFIVYFILRMHSVSIVDSSRVSSTLLEVQDIGNSSKLLSGPVRAPGTIALDILSAAAPVLIPRLAFNLMSENMLFVSLRAMMADFMVLIFLAAWCFAGFLLSMSWLSGDERDTLTISKWMLFVWFGLDGTGVSKSAEFHWLIGPILMIAFAFLGNTLFLTILVSMLTSTFSKIATNSAMEIQFRRAVLTFEGVKSDTIFAYQPPFNVLALCLILPLKLFFSPRWFHKINVTAIRILNAPLLVFVAFYERQNLWREMVSVLRDHTGIIPSDHETEETQLLEASPKIQKSSSRLTRSLQSLRSLSDFSRFSVHGDMEEVFNFPAPDSVVRAIRIGFEGQPTAASLAGSATDPASMAAAATDILATVPNKTLSRKPLSRLQSYAMSTGQQSVAPFRAGSQSDYQRHNTNVSTDQSRAQEIELGQSKPSGTGNDMQDDSAQMKGSTSEPVKGKEILERLSRLEVSIGNIERLLKGIGQQLESDDDSHGNE